MSIQPCQQTWTVASGEALQVCSYANVVFTIGTKAYQHKFNVIEGPFGYNTILGSNALHQFRGVLYLKKGQLQLQAPNSMSRGQGGKQSVPYPLKDLTEEQLTSALDEQAQLTDINKKDQARLHNLLEWNNDVFHIKLEQHRASRTTTHHIELTNPTLIQAKAHCMVLAVQVKINDKVNQMGTTGVSHPSNSKWAAPILLIRKKDRDKWFCVDYHELNKKMKWDLYPMPDMN